MSKPLPLSKDKTLVNISNSILKFFSLPTFHSSYAPLDEVMKNSGKKKIAYILLDGLGMNILEYHKEYLPFISSHLFKTVSSVYPPTTVAATTALCTGLYPIENGHIGWVEYFPEREDFIQVFSSRSDTKDGVVYSPSVQEKEIKPDYIWDILNRNGVKASFIQSFYYPQKGEMDDFDTFFLEADKMLNQNDFTYIYSTQPDSLLHEYGTKHEIISKMVSYLDQKVKQLVLRHKDTLFILTPDHGFADVEEICLQDYPDLLDTLKVRMSTIEPRFATFFVQDEQKFLFLAEKYFGESFHIVSRDELLNGGYLGEGIPHKETLATIGDYTLIAKDKYILENKVRKEDDFIFKGHHAGSTPGEMEIPLCVFNNEK